MELEAYFPYKLAVTAEAFSRKLVEVYGDTFGLSREEWRLLLLLADAGQLNSMELKQRTTLNKVQVSRAAQKLENKKLIKRSIAKQDKRLRQYTCTEKGHNLFSKAFPMVNAQAEKILNSMAVEDRDALNRGIVALSQAIKTRQKN